MRRLGYTRYVAQGGDVGAAVTDAVGRLAPDGLAGIHLNLLRNGLSGGAGLPSGTEQERAALDAIATFRKSLPNAAISSYSAFAPPVMACRHQFWMTASEGSAPGRLMP
jgi:hypothetical protein